MFRSNKDLLLLRRVLTGIFVGEVLELIVADVFPDPGRGAAVCVRNDRHKMGI
jgi:hypothetical protein